MASFFEPESFLFDPTSYDEPSSSSFLSFSSFSDFTSSPFDFSAWDYGSSKQRQEETNYSAPELRKTNSERSNTSDISASPSDPFEIIEAAFEPLTPAPFCADIGIFHTPESSSRVSSSSYSTIAPSSSDPSRHSSSSHSYRSSTSSDSYDDPVTPGLTSRSSVESFASTSTVHPGLITKTSSQPYSWDEASSGLGGSSHYVAPTFQQPHRTTSNPSLASSSRPRVPRPIASMPALKEEDLTATTPSAWFDGTEQLGDFMNTFDFSTLNGSASQQSLSGVQEGASSLQGGTDDVLVDDFDWVFGEFGLGMADMPQDGTIFSAFQQPEEQGSSTGSSSVPTFSADSITDNVFVDNTGASTTAYERPLPLPYHLEQQQQGGPLSHQQDQQWLPTPTAQDAVVFPTYDYSAIMNMPSFTIDPMTFMAPNGSEGGEEMSRPSSAPGFNPAEGSTGMLGVPPGQMTRSVSSDGFVPQRHAAPRDLFSYAPQQMSSGPPAPQPLYTTEPSLSYSNYLPQSMPLTPAHTRRASMTGLTVQIQPPSYSTYVPSPLPPTPISATFGDVGSFQQQQQQAHQMLQQPPRPVAMARAGTQPLPQTRRLSGSEPFTSAPSKHKMPAHLARAQAIVQAQEANAEAERQAYRRKAAAARVPMSQASVMQPQYSRPPQTIMGWEGPSAQTTNLPVLTTTPLVTIHPPQPSYHVQHIGPTHRVHPPPDTRSAASVSRPVAKMPTSPSKRKVSASPNKRSPAGKKRQPTQPMQPGGFSWGETTFINFTADDAEKLLTGVAPSGSQGKRKREEEAAAAAGGMDMGMMMGMEGVQMDRERSKRSRSGE